MSDAEWQFANVPVIEYGHCKRCGGTVFMAVRRGRIARWRHDRNRWHPVWHRPQPVMCDATCAEPDENPWPVESHWWGPYSARPSYTPSAAEPTQPEDG